MSRYGKIIAFFATIGWLAFTFSAFKGFHFWYAGFVFCLWLSLAAVNYYRHTSLWFLKNNPRTLFFFYLHIVVLSFFTDFFIGQKLTNFWSYPFYSSFLDWLRLYFIVYPFGCIAVLELVYFLSQVFGEPLVFTKKKLDLVHRFVDKLDVIWVYVIYVIIFTSPLVLIYGSFGGYESFVF